MWLMVEGNRLINLELVDTVVFEEHQKRATLMAQGATLFADSKVAYEYFKSGPDVRRINWDAVQSGQAGV